MPVYHTVSQGECLSRIAANYGFADYRVIYDDPNNADFRAKRPNPNVIFPGDVIFIPDKREKTVQLPTTAVHRFQIATGRRMLRIIVQGPDGKPVSNAAYDLVAGARTFKGTTDSTGLLEQRIAPDAEDGSLTIGHCTWPLAIAHLNPMEDAPDGGASGIQARLRNLGYDPGPVDGIIGERTKAAVRAFQADNPPLQVDGVCGPQTRAKLIERYGC